MYHGRIKNIWFSLFLLAGFLIGCSPKSTPPGANSVGGVLEEAVFSYHFWEEGLAILIWHDFTYGGEGCSGTGSTEDPVYRLECTVESIDGRSFSWQVHSRDGITADMWIDGQKYDLSQGTMFLIKNQDGALQVDQVQRDFSELAPSYEAIAALTDSDPAVKEFIAQIGAEGNAPAASDQDGLVKFIDDLRLAAESVAITGKVDQPFFSVPAQNIVVNGDDVQVFEYSDSASAESEAAQISADGSSVGTTMISWVAPPHFYTKGRLIVLYVGENIAVLNALADVLGKPIAEG